MTKYALNIDSIRELCDQVGVKYTLSNKAFYRKFAYNISLRNISWWHNNDRVAEQKRREYLALVFKQQKITKLMDRLGIDYRFRREQNYNLYLSDTNIVRRILNTMSEDVLLIDGPKNEQHLDVLLSNRKIIVKPHLYYKKYRFKVAYNTNTEFKQDIMPVLQQYVKDVPPENIKISNNYYKLIREMSKVAPSLPPGSKSYGQLASWHYRQRVSPWNIISVYFADEDDFVMYKMMVGGNTLHEYEVVLQQDL